jgi:hypothetical protein
MRGRIREGRRERTESKCEMERRWRTPERENKGTEEGERKEGVEKGSEWRKREGVPMP